ncbi:hypothetical protein [Bradyrhizobium sp. USDA 4451]
MELWTISELMHFTRDELCRLSTEIEHVLPRHEPGTVERLHALSTLENIRRVMAIRGFHF